MHEGSLADLRAAMLPPGAALGGVVVPALLYLFVNPEPLARRGWAIPTATDIAFAVGVLALAAAAAVRSGLCALPDGLRWSHVALLGALGGIGFTMSIFISRSGG